MPLHFLISIKKGFFMKEYDIMCIGLSTVDLIMGPVAMDLMERDTTYVSNMHLCLGGDALNQAVILSKLGNRVGLMALVGDDFFGKYLISTLQEQKVDTTYIQVEKNAATTVSVVMREECGERHFVAYRGCIDRLGVEHINMEALAKARYVSMASNLALKGLDGQPTCELFSYAKKKGAITLADYSIGKVFEYVDKHMVSEMLKVTDYAVPSIAEAVTITGETETKRIIEALRDMGATNIILKMGDKGCYVHADGEKCQIEALKANALDTTGAGDSFVAGFLYGKNLGKDILSCVKLGCAAGAIGVEAVGATTAMKDAAQLMRRAGF